MGMYGRGLSTGADAVGSQAWHSAPETAPGRVPAGPMLTAGCIWMGRSPATARRPAVRVSAANGVPSSRHRRTRCHIFGVGVDVRAAKG